MSEFQINSPFPRVLSIQSSVVYGYVGNKCSVYGLQARQIEVDPLLTCQFSNHTGYTSWKGFKVTGEELDKTIVGLSDNGLLSQYTHILLGYIAEQSFIERIAATIAQMKQQRIDYISTLTTQQQIAHPNVEAPLVADNRVIFLCDPVLGDGGALYVPSSFIQIYKDQILPLADIITPNETELSCLSGITKFNNQDDVAHACELLHDIGTPLIIVTSICDYFSSTDSNYSVTIPSGTDDFYIKKVIGYPTSDVIKTAWKAELFSTLLGSTSTEPDLQLIPLLSATPLPLYNYTTPECLTTEVNDKMKYDGTICTYISYKCKETGLVSSWVLKLPRFDQYIAGTGDLTASLILSHLQQRKRPSTVGDSFLDPQSLVDAICHAFSTIHMVVRITILRSIVCKHVAKCPSCYALQKDNLLSTLINFQSLPVPNTNAGEISDVDSYAEQVAERIKNLSSLPQAKIAVPFLPTAALELWLTGVHDEFTNPSCSILPTRIK